MQAPIPVKMTATTPVGGTSFVGTAALGGYAPGLGAYPTLSLVADLQGQSGGVTDVYLQTRDVGEPWSGSPWRDIAHFTQIAAGGAAVSYRIVFQRGIGAPTTPQSVNTADGTPTLAANTVLAWANGADFRLVVVSGAGGAGGGVQTIQGFATQAD